MTICAYEVDCADVADLGDADGWRDSGVAPADVACAWEDLVARGVEPPSWRLAHRLIDDGYAGIVVLSFAPGAAPTDRNVVLWRWSNARPHKVMVIDDESRLPRDGRSWEPKVAPQLRIATVVMPESRI